MLVQIALVVVGLGLGALCAVASLVLGGIGEGWTAAWPFGLMSLALFPLAFCNLANRKKWARAASLVMLVVALGLDLALYAATISQGVRFFERELTAGWAWIGLWSVWQIAFLATACLAPARAPSE